MWLSEKLNPGQRFIALDQGEQSSTEPEQSYIYYYKNLEIVNRAVNMVVDDAAEIDFKVMPDKINTPLRSGVKAITVERLLNKQPNPFQDFFAFRRNLIMDLILDGNIFIYFDGNHLYQLPAADVTIIPDKLQYVERYDYNKIKYYPNEIIHIKDNSSDSIYRGASRLKPAVRTMRLMKLMRDFQDNFFKNGAVPGLVIKTPDVLSQRIKDRMKQEWRQTYRPQSGGRNPMILDGGMEIDALSNVNFQELDFAQSLIENEKVILKSLGVPPILVDSGNNANIKPNHRLYYLETVVPISHKLCAAFQNFFGFEICHDYSGIPALQPELKEQAAYYSTLVNGGIMTPDEGRSGLGLDPLPDGEGDVIRIPQNIAGSAADPSQGGKPSGDNSE